MKIFTGKVIRKNSEKTATIEVVQMMAHPVYGKRVKRSRKYQVHDEMGAKEGNNVRFVACRPISKTKKWKISEIIGQPSEKKATRKKGKK